MIELKPYVRRIIECQTLVIGTVERGSYPPNWPIIYKYHLPPGCLSKVSYSASWLRLYLVREPQSRPLSGQRPLPGPMIHITGIGETNH